jgi:lipoyl(octanoyl) transferase
MESWLLVRSGLADSAWNMALDEALLEAMSRLGQPVLRFYGWTEPAASFGYFQKYAEVETRTPLRPLVRRPTGGGIVPHAEDWTYSVAFPVAHPWYSLSAVESYRRMHAWIQAAFARLGVETQLAPHALKTTPGQCFTGYEESDLLWRGRKIAGAAQRRRRDGLLIQGSVQMPAFAFDRFQWEQAMAAARHVEYGVVWTRCEPDAPLRERARGLAALKYSQPDYNRKR